MLTMISGDVAPNGANAQAAEPREPSDSQRLGTSLALPSRKSRPT